MQRLKLTTVNKDLVSGVHLWQCYLSFRCLIKADAITSFNSLQDIVVLQDVHLLQWNSCEFQALASHQSSTHSDEMR